MAKASSTTPKKSSTTKPATRAPATPPAVAPSDDLLVHRTHADAPVTTRVEIARRHSIIAHEFLEALRELDRADGCLMLERVGNKDMGGDTKVVPEHLWRVRWSIISAAATMFGFPMSVDAPTAAILLAGIVERTGWTVMEPEHWKYEDDVNARLESIEGKPAVLP